VRIGIARDPAFSFIYPANLDLLRAMGAELVFTLAYNARERRGENRSRRPRGNELDR
jgi:cobyrinic acid a,c-diamide synthase